MLFHVIKELQGDADSQYQVPETFSELEQKSRTPTKRLVSENRPWMVTWATLLVLFFVVASFVAHHDNWPAAETIFLNLTVAIVSASLGAFFGERSAVKRLLG